MCAKPFTTGFVSSENWFNFGSFELSLNPILSDGVSQAIGLNFLDYYDIEQTPIIQVRIDKQKFPNSHVGLELFNGTCYRSFEF